MKVHFLYRGNNNAIKNILKSFFELNILHEKSTGFYANKNVASALEEVFFFLPKFNNNNKLIQGLDYARDVVGK